MSGYNFIEGTRVAWEEEREKRLKKLKEEFDQSGSEGVAEEINDLKTDQKLERVEHIYEHAGKMTHQYLQNLSADIACLTKKYAEVERAWKFWDLDTLSDHALMPNEEVEFVKDMEANFTFDCNKPTPEDFQHE